MLQVAGVLRSGWLSTLQAPSLNIECDSATLSGKVVAVQFSADGSRCVAVDDADVRVEVDGLPPDSDILDMLAQRQVDVSVLPE